jgi:preprotein translocase subunit SecG
VTLLADPSLALLIDVVQGLVFVLFVLCALLLMLVVLLQEGKGGGLGSAFGGAAADAFGVKAGTVNKFTTWLATGFLGLALLYAGLSSSGDQRSMVPAAPTPPALESTDGEAGQPAAPADAPADTPPDAPPDEGTEDDG